LIRRSSRILLEAVAALLAGITIIFALGAWRLAGDEPIRLGFLTPYLEQALTAPDRSFSLRIDETLLTWAGWERTFDLRARGVRAVGPSGRTIAAVPEIAVSLSAPALLRGLVAPTSIDLFRPRLFLSRGPGGRLKIGRIGAEEEVSGDEEHGASILPGLLAELLRPPDRDRPTGYLRSASIIDGKLVFSDRQSGLTWRAPDADITLRRQRRGIAGDLSIALEQLGDPARLQAAFSYSRSRRSVDLSARFVDVALAALAELDPDLAPLAGAELIAEGRIETTIGLDGTVGASRFRLATGAGRLVLPALYGAPLPVRQLTVAGGIDAGGDRLTLDEAALQLDGPRLTVTGTATGLAQTGLTPHGASGAGSIHLAGYATAADVPAQGLARYWPADVARGAREWVTRNIDEGVVEHAEADFAIRLPGGDAGAAVVERLNGALSAVGLAVHYMREMPPIRGVDGVASFTRETFVADFSGGGAEGLSIESGQVRITELDRRRHEMIEIDGRVRGALPDALRLLDYPRLGYPSKLGLNPADTAGEAVAHLWFRFPAKKGLTFDEVEIDVNADVTAATFDNAMFERDVTHGDFTVEVTSESMTVAGHALFGGVPAGVRWIENFFAAEFRSRIALYGTPDAAQLASLGFDFRPYVEGPVSTDLLLTRFGDGRGRLTATFGLAEAALELPFVGWSKAPGASGTAKLEVTLDGERAVEIRNFSVTAGTLLATGHGRFAESGEGLRRVVLDFVALGESELEDVTVDLDEDGFDVAIGGGRLDAEPLFSNFAEAAETTPDEETLTTFTLRADRLRELRLGPGRSITEVTAILNHDGTFWNRIAIDGTLANGAPMRLRYGPAAPDKHQLIVTAADAGAALRTLGIIDNVIGGRLRITAETDDAAPDRPLRGRAEISEFRLVDAPALARLLTVATLTGLVDVLTGEGFLFTRFVGDFTKTGDRLEVSLARAYGPSIGLTATGDLDFGTDTVDMKGTIVPAYAINNILGNIPLVGDALQGGKGEGIFAATYAASGSIAEPRITINPLAALAPGFLRSLFELLGTSGEQTGPTALPEPGTNK
jgi:hypothetical protein